MELKGYTKEEIKTQFNKTEEAMCKLGMEVKKREIK